jgi:hypothetical protein
VKIRVMGDSDQVAVAVAVLEAFPGLHVTDVSRPYPNRRDPGQVRVYLDATVLDHCPLCASTVRVRRGVIDEADGPAYCDDEWHDGGDA